MQKKAAVIDLNNCTIMRHLLISNFILCCQHFIGRLFHFVNYSAFFANLCTTIHIEDLIDPHGFHTAHHHPHIRSLQNHFCETVPYAIRCTAKTFQLHLLNRNEQGCSQQFVQKTERTPHFSDLEDDVCQYNICFSLASCHLYEKLNEAKHPRRSEQQQIHKIILFLPYIFHFVAAIKLLITFDCRGSILILGRLTGTPATFCLQSVEF